MLLTVAEVTDGGAVLATGGVVDLPGIPPRLSGDGLLHVGPRIHRLSGQTLGSAGRRKHQDPNVSAGPERQRQTYASASAFCTGFQDNVTVLLNDGGLWKRSWIRHGSHS